VTRNCRSCCPRYLLPYPPFDMVRHALDFAVPKQDGNRKMMMLSLVLQSCTLSSLMIYKIPYITYK